jgi:hypothetical protein
LGTPHIIFNTELCGVYKQTSNCSEDEFTDFYRSFKSVLKMMCGVVALESSSNVRRAGRWGKEMLSRPNYATEALRDPIKDEACASLDDTCNNRVTNNPATFNEAYWLVGPVKIHAQSLILRTQGWKWRRILY